MSYQDDNYRDNPSSTESDRDRYDDRYQDDRDRDDRERTGIPGVPGQPPTKGGCSKGCLYGAAGCGCLTILMFVVMGVLSWKAVDFVMKGMSTDPAAIRAATQEMADIKPPAGFEPTMKMDLYVCKVVLYEHADHEASLSVVQINPQFAQKDAKQNRELGEGFRQGFGNGPDDHQKELKIGKSEFKDVTIRGQVIKVKFSEAKDSAGDEFRLIDAQFQGKTSQLLLLLTLPLEEYDEAEVKKFLESIK